MTKKSNYVYQLKRSPKFYLLIITILYFSYVSLFTNINGDWRHFIDSEILWPYNILLILSKKEIEFTAYGFFYFFLEYKFFQLFELLGYLKTTSIENLNNGKNFSEKLENLIFLGRLFNIIIIYLTILMALIIFNDLSKNIILAFLLTIIFMLSPGMIQQISHARVDVLASSLLFLSYFYLIKFSEEKTKKLFIFFIICFFLSALTKVQSYIFLSLILISSIYFINFENILKKDISLSISFKSLNIIFILTCLIYPLIFHRHAKLSLIFIYSQLLILNVYLLFIFNKSKNFWDKKLIFNSLIFIIILALIILINNLNYLTSHAIRLTFFEPMEIRMYLNDSTLKGMDVITLDVKNNLIYFYNLFLNIYVKFKLTTFIILGKFNSNTLLILFNIVLIFYFCFVKKNKKKLLLITPIISFFLVNGINQIRGQGLEMYLTYSEFLLYVPICVLFRKSNQRAKKYISIMLVLILIMPIYFYPNKFNSERYEKTNRFIIWCDTFLANYTKSISPNEIKKICN